LHWLLHLPLPWRLLRLYPLLPWRLLRLCPPLPSHLLQLYPPLPSRPPPPCRTLPLQPLVKPPYGRQGSHSHLE
jgi:hypothetical protein